MNLHLDASDFAQLADFWQRAPDLTRSVFTTAITAIDAELVGTLKQELPRGAAGSAGLRGSIASEETALADNVVGMVYSRAPYAAYVELGTKPHPVNAQGIQALADWVQEKFQETEDAAIGIAHAIAWKIRRKGTPANPVWRTAWQAAQPRIRAIFDAAMQRIAQELARGQA